MILHIIRIRNRYDTKITSHKDIPSILSSCQNNPKLAFPYQIRRSQTQTHLYNICSWTQALFKTVLVLPDYK